MDDGNAAAWDFLRDLRAYRAAWLERPGAGAPRYEDAPFPIRIQAEADLAAGAPWGLHAWEDPFARDGPASPFWDAPMLAGEGSATAPPLRPLLDASGARPSGLRLLCGALILRIEHEGQGYLMRLSRDSPLLAGGGLRLWHDFGLELPTTIARLTDLLAVLGRPAPRRGRGRWAKGGNC